MPERIVTIPVSSRLDFGDPHIYVAIVVTNVGVAEVSNRYLLITARPFRGHIDWRSVGPEWSNLPAASPSAYDLKPDQLAKATDGVRKLGFSDASIHAWMVSARGNVLGQGWSGMVNVGEILVDLGASQQAAGNIERLTGDYGNGLGTLEDIARAHVALSYAAYPQWNCPDVKRRTRSALTKRAAGILGGLEVATGFKLAAQRVDTERPSWVLCSDLHPITIDSTNAWNAPSVSGFASGYVTGVARYHMRDRISLHRSVASNSTYRETEPYWKLEPFEGLNSMRYLAASYALQTTLRPDAALLTFQYRGLSRPELQSRLSSSSAIGIGAEDASVGNDSGITTLRIRFWPATNERAKRIEAVFAAGAQYEPRLALFTKNCDGRDAAIASAIQQARRSALRAAKLIRSNIIEPLAIRLRVEDVGNATCGFSNSATTEQLAALAMDTEPFPAFPEPMVARFPIRVDVAWLLSGAPAPHIPADRTYSRRWPGPSCLDAGDAALQQDIEAALLDYHSIWSLLVHPPSREPNYRGQGCLDVDQTITVLKHP